jgi:hypothetical protein
MNAPTEIVVVDRDELDARVYASLTRALQRARIEKKLPVLTLMARTAADNVAARRQQYTEDLWTIAEELGLVNRLGAPRLRAQSKPGSTGARCDSAAQSIERRT